MNKLAYLLLLTPLFLNLHCEKDKEDDQPATVDYCAKYGVEDEKCREQELAKLPPVTESGEDTFGCLINGKAFIPSTCCGDFFNPPLPKIRSDFYVTQNNYYVGAINRLNREDDYFEFGLNIFSDFEFSGVQKFPITKTSAEFNTSGGGVFIYTKDSVIDYDTYDPQSGWVEIFYLDTLNQVVSGVFEFKASNGTDTIEVTDGRFDLHYSLQ